ncbi:MULTISPECIES: DUF1707 domain-containing protein [unclassified Mycolicibacterium]|uniref:DUF1707 domain-containing protein n=2 Tax=unclassified Mycolicibacterium TaxID=2636767 RepID=UPI002814E0E9|nr:DUF1707 domain-containing protein [Mycolicibacterium sp. CBMA 335]
MTMYHHEDLRLQGSSRYTGGSVMTDSPDAHIRPSDADREGISGRLSRAVADGRLTLTEFDDRLQQLYRAETRGELVDIVSDLPRSDDRSKMNRQRKQAIPAWVVIMWMPWVAVNTLCLGIWLATGGGYFWPFWVAVPWACALVIPSAIGVLTGRDTRSRTARSAPHARVRSCRAR